MTKETSFRLPLALSSERFHGVRSGVQLKRVASSLLSLSARLENLGRKWVCWAGDITAVVVCDCTVLGL